MRTSGVLAGAGLLGGSASTAAAHDGFHAEFASPRVWELQKVWERGVRGHPRRSVGVADSGCDARHPDLPWNGVRIETGDDGATLQEVTVGEGEDEPVGDVGPYTGQLGPGVADANQAQRAVHELDVPAAADEIDVTATWTPQDQDNELLLLDEDGNTKASSTDFNPGSGEGEQLKAPVEPGDKVAVKTYINVGADYEITGTYLETPIEIDELPDGYDPLPAAVDGDTPKLVGWQGGTLARDGDGHGSHVSSISAGTGRGSAVDESNVTEEEPRTVLVPGDSLEYEVTPEAGNADSERNGGVFAAVYGTNVDVEIEAPDGRTVETASLDAGTTENDGSYSGDVTIADAYADVEGTYSVHVTPRYVEGVGPQVGRVERVSVGALLPPAETTDEAVRSGEVPTLHAGIAPNASLVTLQGFTRGMETVAEFTSLFTDTFGLRSVNFSAGGLPPERLGLSDKYRRIEEMAAGGVLTVSSAGNNGPLTGATGQSGADEAIAVAATGPMDGLTGYTSGGTVVRGEDDGNGGGTPAGEFYRKPDVSAPGGFLTDNMNAVEAGDPESDDPVRDYIAYAGTSMAAPYVNGVAGLVAQAMEFGTPDAADDRPEALGLPAPAETGYEDVLRLKQVILSTASETAFTAAPYHRAHAPTYDFGERDQFEGYGRVNPGAAVDAVTRELAPGTTAETVGLNRHVDDRAVAGYLPDDEGTFTVSAAVSHLSGANTGMAKGDPHVDVYVYDLADPLPNGKPTIVARDMGVRGDAGVSFSATEDGAYVVVAKLVNVPGVVNGYDVQVHFDLSVEFEGPSIVRGGSREDDGSVFTAGETNMVEVSADTRESVEFRDTVPIEWDVDTEFSDDVNHVHTDADAGVHHVVFTGHGTDAGEDSPEATYFVRAPEGPEGTGQYTFGPLEVRPEGGDDDEWVAVGGTSDTNYVVGQSV
jgi:hypothetical protein